MGRRAENRRNRRFRESAHGDHQTYQVGTRSHSELMLCQYFNYYVSCIMYHVSCDDVSCLVNIRT
jgi:hypothetical protein